MDLIRYQGRKVSSHWYRRYVLAAGQRSIAAQRRVQPVRPYALFYLPALPFCGEEAETRLIGVGSQREREWIVDMQENYAGLDPRHLPTFFPNHPQL